MRVDGMTKRSSSLAIFTCEKLVVLVSVLMMRTSSEAHVMCLFPFNSIQV